MMTQTKTWIAKLHARKWPQFGDTKRFMILEFRDFRETTPRSRSRNSLDVTKVRARIQETAELCLCPWLNMAWPYLKGKNTQYCDISRLSLNKTSTVIVDSWSRITWSLSNSNVSRPRYNSAVVACAGCFAAIVEGKVQIYNKALYVCPLGKHQGLSGKQN